MFKKRFVLFSLTVASTWMILFTGLTEAKIPAGNERRAQKKSTARPDLLVEKIEITSEPMLSGKVVLNIAYTITNDSSAPSRCCPTEAGKNAWKNNSIMTNMFPAVIEAREYPKGQFYEIETGTSAIELKAHEKQTFYATEIFSQDTQWEFRITVDPGNWIEEQNEENNEKTQVWTKEDTKR
ncbi:MAG: hypothetical protein JXB23_15090 [Candidatus Aminicenantes bacterium]|nr:hypothetical protein [Candidatus Aminicenantes bacterium]